MAEISSGGENAGGFLETLDRRVVDILDACTKCGDCVAVCPTPRAAGFEIEDPGAVAAGVLEILKTGDGPELSKKWTESCCGSGFCVSACDYGINPRFMLAMAQRASRRSTPEVDRRETGKTAFQSMARGVRVLSRLQLTPDLLQRLSPSSHPERDEAPDLVFYTGCNMLRTPHIGLLCLDVLDRLDVSYEVHGGPANCCGILQMRPGDTANAGRQADKTLERFANTKTAEVLSWCPTCQIQFSENIVPGRDEDAPDKTPFDMTMFAVYLARRLDKLRPLLIHPVNKTVALHEYPGAQGVTEAVIELLSSIEGLTFVDLEMTRIGYQMTSLKTVPGASQKLLADTFRAAESAGVTTLAGVYHADHRELCSHEDAWPFEIVNFMELIGEAMGLHREDLFKQYKLMQDVDAVLAASKDTITQNNLDPEEVRNVVLSDMLNEQLLPIDRSLHPS
jgi:heterodisulfide reductase subunit D